MNEKQDLQLILNDSDLPADKIKSLQQCFEGSFKSARELVDSSKAITVTSSDQVKEMKLARENRLKLRDIRVEVEHTRVELKAQIVREGKAIDGFANILKALIIPAEEHLEKQEKFAEIAQQKMITERLATRIDQLSPFVSELGIYNLREMSDTSFTDLLSFSKKMWQAGRDAEAKEEADRAESIRKQAILNDRRFALAPYHQPGVNDFPNLSIDTTEEEYKKILAEAVDKKKKADQEQEQIRLENERMKKEREEKARLEAIEKKKHDEALAKERADQQRKIDVAHKEAAEAKRSLQAQKDAQLEKERLELAAIEAKKQAEEEASRQAILAPDKVKLIDFASSIVLLTLPALSSRDAQKIGDAFKIKLENLAADLRNEASKL